MVEGLLVKQEKPSNTEVLGLLMDKDKLNFITNVTHENIEGYNGLKFWTNLLFNKESNIEETFEEIKENILSMKCAVQIPKKGNRADQIVDALKHIIEDENKDNLSSIAEQIKK